MSRREIARRDPHELRHPARVETRGAPRRAVHESSRQAGRAVEAGRVVMRHDAVARGEPRTPSPTSTISPATSCPRTVPAFVATYQSSRSEPQMPAARVRISASPGPMRGAGISATVDGPPRRSGRFIETAGRPLQSGRTWRSGCRRARRCASRKRGRSESESRLRSRGRADRSRPRRAAAIASRASSGV